MQMFWNNYLIVDTCDLISNICRCLYHFKSKCYKTGWFNSVWEEGVSLVCQYYITWFQIKKLKNDYKFKYVKIHAIQFIFRNMMPNKSSQLNFSFQTKKEVCTHTIFLLNKNKHWSFHLDCSIESHWND